MFKICRNKKYFLFLPPDHNFSLCSQNKKYLTFVLEFYKMDKNKCPKTEFPKKVLAKK